MAKPAFIPLPEPVFERDPDGGFTVYDMVFEDIDGALWDYPDGTPEDSRVDPTSWAAQHSVPAGRIGPVGPGIAPQQWPRDPTTGMPMMHIITLWLPEHFRRRGPDLPGIALFQGAGEAFMPLPDNPDPADPFIIDLRHHRPHPQQILLTDILDLYFAAIWLTADELTQIGSPPADRRRPGEHAHDGLPRNAWNHDDPPMLVRLTPRRNDPNAGIAPVERDATTDSPYLSTWGDGDHHAWADRLQWSNHLGGTVFPCQWIPDGLTPYYLDLFELPGMNIGTGTLQYDLESNVFDWACG